MSRFYFHLRNGAEVVDDDEGLELADVPAARATAIEGLRDILAGDVRRGVLNIASFIEIEDDQRRPVMTVSLAEVLRLTAEAPGRSSTIRRFSAGKAPAKPGIRRKY